MNQFLPSKGKLCPRSSGSAYLHRKAAVLVCLLLGAVGMKAQLTFDENVRYSQWAINSHVGDFYANTTKYGFAVYDQSGNQTQARSTNKTKLDYVPGLVAKAIVEAADYYQSSWAKPWFLSIAEYGNTYASSVETTGESLDNLNAVKLYFGLRDLSKTDGVFADNTTYNNTTTALNSAITGLTNTNKTYSIGSDTKAGSDVAGGWFHKKAYNNQMWCDGAYMGSALFAQLINYSGKTTNIDTSSDWSLAAKQLTIVWKMCWNSTDKLLYHAFEANAGGGTSNSHADTWYGLNATEGSYVFHSASYWGRANAWYLLALVDVLEQMQTAKLTDTDDYKTLKTNLESLAAGLKARQDATTGGWYQLLDKDASYTASSYNSNWSGKPSSATNYIETSATAIISAAFFKANRLGLLADEYKTAAKTAYEGIVKNYAYVDSNNKLQFFNSCLSAGLGGGTGNDYKSGGKKFRDGSNEYYLLGYDVPKVEKSDGYTEGKVLGGFIMAATEYERAYLPKETKSILFSRPVTLSSSNVLSAEALTTGTGTITYQWYKQATASKAKSVVRKVAAGDTKIDGATSSTYTPTASGNYYVVASDGTNSVESSIMTVTLDDSGDSGDDSKEDTNASATVDGVGTAVKNTDGGVTITFSNSSDLYASKVTVYYGDNSTVAISAPSDTKNLTWSQDDFSATFGSDYTAQKGYVKVTKGKSGTLSITVPSGTDVTKVVLTYGSGSSKLSESEATFSLTAATTYTITAAVAEASKDMGTVAIKSGSSTITSGAAVTEGTSLTITATANDGYEFDSWSATGTTGTASGSTYIISSIAANTTVTATFKAKSTKTALTASFATTSASVVKGTTSYTLPALTVKAGSTTLTATTDYTVSYESGNTTVATAVADGTVTLASDQTGSATITATITPTDATKYESTTATFTITVAEELSKTYTFAVDKKTTYTRNQTIWVTDNDGANIARVVLGGWMFPNAIAKVYGGKCTSEGLGTSGKDWGSTSEKKSGSDEYVENYPAQVQEGSNNNARQEQGSNAQPGSTGIYNGKIVSQGTIRDAMFNVPCSGAYLVYTAKVPGTITSVIFQNGVFDKSSSSSSSKNAYRPQRRVFVMDEAGQIVSCTAKLMNSTGSLPSNSYDGYEWDLGTMPTDAAGVQAHFVGLTDFSIEKASFKNGVYESNLSYDVCKNEVLKDETLKDVTGKGYRGWSILADGPVAYTFDVLPGKTYYIYDYGSRIGFYGFTFTPKDNVTTDEIALKEDGSVTVEKTADGHMATVSLDRTFKGGIWNSCVLPFSMNKQQIDEIFGATYSTDNESGTQIIYFDEVRNDSVLFVRHAYNSIVAGKPFLIKPSKTGDITLNTASLTDCPYKYVTIESTEPTEWCADDNWAWTSSYKKGVVKNGDHFIGSGNGKLIGMNRTSGQADIAAFRGFLKAKTTESAAKVGTLLIGNADNTFGIEDENEPTAIIRLEQDSDGNYVERPTSGKIYSINGQIVSNDANDLSSLPSGIYIVNGKKYVK